MILLANAERLGWEAIAAALKPPLPPLTEEAMKSLLNLLRAKESTAADFRQALASLPIATAANTLAEAEAHYRQQLLEGETGAAIEATQREILEAKTECDRLRVFSEELSEKAILADQREALDALAAKRDAAETEAKAVAALFAKRYGPLVTEVVGLIERLEAAEAGIVEANQALSAAGMVDRLPDVESRFSADNRLVAGRRLRYFLGMEGGMAEAGHLH